MDKCAKWTIIKLECSVMNILITISPGSFGDHGRYSAKGESEAYDPMTWNRNTCVEYCSKGNTQEKGEAGEVIPGMAACTHKPPRTRKIVSVCGTLITPEKSHTRYIVLYPSRRHQLWAHP